MPTIRCATKEDIPALLPLLTQLFTQEAEFAPDPAAQARGLEAIIGGAGMGAILLAEQEGRAVAMLNLLYTVSTALGGRVAILEDMVVDASCRGSGIGSKLIAQGIETARADGCQRVTVLSDQNNLDAHRLYERFGFVRSAMVPFRLVLSQTLEA
jgi:GNAT superfamily N-acetyltransferase